MEYQWQKKRPVSQEKKASGQSEVPFGGGFYGGVPNSAMLDMLDNQIPAAEREADRLSAGVTASDPEALKAAMSARLGADFSGVRFHTDGAAVQRAEEMGARAWTQGRDVYFGAGGFDPTVAAHELVHTAQQGAVEAGTPTMSVQSGTVQMWPKWLKNIFKKRRDKKEFKNTPFVSGKDELSDVLDRRQKSYGGIPGFYDDDDLSMDEDFEAESSGLEADAMLRKPEENQNVINTNLASISTILRESGKNKNSRKGLNGFIDSAFSNMQTEKVGKYGLYYADKGQHDALVNQSANRMAKRYSAKAGQEEIQAAMNEESAKYRQAMDSYQMSDERKKQREEYDTKTYGKLKERLEGMDGAQRKNYLAVSSEIGGIQETAMRERDKKMLWSPAEAGNRFMDNTPGTMGISKIISGLGRTPTKKEYQSMEKMCMEYPKWVELLMR